MPSTTLKRRWSEDGMKGRAPKKHKKVKRQRAYHSSSEDEGEYGAADAPRDVKPRNLNENAKEEEGRTSLRPKLTGGNAVEKLASPAPIADAEATSEAEEEEEQDEVEDRSDEESDASEISEASEASSLSDASADNTRKVRKRNDPEAFATSISKILNTKLTSQKRSEPILSRSKAAQETNRSLSDHKLTVKAHRKILEDKKAVQEKGRVKDVLGLSNEGVSTAEIMAEEKRLRKTAQKGVIKLFNAVRAAQKKAEEAERDAKQRGVVGMAAREEKIKEMSKQGFLDMISGGAGKKEGSVEV